MQSALQQASQLLSQGKIQTAEEQLRILLADNPKHEESLALLGHSLMMQNRLDDAIQTFKALIKFHPKSTDAFVELANAYQAKGDNQAAESAFQRAIELNPLHCNAWHFLGNLLMQRGERKQAKQCFMKAQQNDPFKNHFATVQQALKQRKFHDAEQICREVLKRHANHTQALHTLARLAEQVEAYEEAVKILKQGLKYAPYHISLWQSLVKNLALLGKFDEAIEGALNLVSIEHENVNFKMLLAEVYANAGQYEKSLTVYDQALILRPNEANIHLLRGHVLKTLGRREACELAYQKSISLERINGTAFWSLADLKSHRFGKPEIEHMKALFEDKNVPPAQAAQAGFALAKSYEDDGQFEKAFKHYQKANQLRPNVHFVPAEYHQQCKAIANGFSSSILANQAGSDETAATPIFIVGLTRSGSTLIEQILASHSQIEGTMELYSLPRTIRRAGIKSTKKGKPYPELMDQFTERELSELGRSYLDETAIFRSDKKFFIDKMPPNFHNVGLIHMILPHAIIIDARRHPLSSGLSNFKQHFAGGYDFSYDLETIGQYYNGYLELMDHWDTVLPGKVLCVQYENMVTNTENQIRQILAHCGLAFEPQCLKFHENKRAVRTASSEQVRQPINKRGMQQWRNFEEFLTPLKKSLGETTLSRFAAYIG